MRIPGWLIYLVMIVLGAAVLSPVIAQIGLDPIPGDFTIVWHDFTMAVPVLYSLGASVVLALLFWFFRR